MAAESPTPAPTPTAPPLPLPPIAALDGATLDEFARLVSPLFEGAPAFVDRLAGARPFRSWATFFERADSVSRALEEPELVELLESHPRIGVPTAGLSEHSRREQGGVDPTSALAARLAELNRIYEERFGFRFVVFVAGRPRDAIVPVMEQRLGAPRAEELERARADVISIARDRATRMGVS